MLSNLQGIVAFLHSFTVYWALLISYIGLIGGVRVASDSIDKSQGYPAMRSVAALVATAFLAKLAMDWTLVVYAAPSDFVQTSNDQSTALGVLILCQLLSAMFSFTGGFAAGYGARLAAHVARKPKTKPDSNNQDK